MRLKLNNKLNKLFAWAIEKDMVRFKFSEEIYWKLKTRLTVEYKVALNARPKPKDYTWKLCCAHNIEDYSLDENINRVTMMFVSTLQRVEQDMNIVYDEYTIKRK